MKKVLLSTLFILLLCKVAFAQTVTPEATPQIIFKDVPQKHWAEEAVYYAVKEGLIKGYPDGTFRGENKIIRYETAMLIRRSAKAIDIKVEKWGSGLREELKELRRLIAQVPTEEAKPPKIVTGSYEIRYRLGNLLGMGAVSEGLKAPMGPKVDYRLKTTFSKDLWGGTQLKINLDTMDAGFGGGNGDLATKLLDLEGKVKTNMWGMPVDIKATLGPGAVSHRDTTGIIPSEDYMIYVRPKPSLTLSTSVGKADLSLSYVARQVSRFSSGEVGVSELTGNLEYSLDKLPLLGGTKIEGRWRYLWHGQENLKDLRGELICYFQPYLNLSGKGILGIGTPQNSPHGLYANAELTYDSIETGTIIRFKAHKIGTEYRLENLNKYEFVYLNFFNKLILDGTVDLGMEISQKTSEKVIVKGKVDVVLSGDYKYGASYPGTSLTAEGQVDWYVTPKATLYTGYKIYQVPSGIDQFGTSVNTTTDVLTFGSCYNF